MKTRIVHTKIWEDDWFASISRSSRIIFLYLLTCPQNNLSGIFEMPERVLCFNAVVTQSEIETAKAELAGRVAFYGGWIKLLKSNRYNNYISNNDMKKALQKEIDAIPDVIKKVLIEGEGGDTPRDTPRVYPSNNHKEEIINNKYISNKNKHLPTQADFEKINIQEICTDYSVPESFVLSKWDDVMNYCHGNNKRYADFNRTLRNWVKKDALKITQEAHGKSTIGFITTE